MLDYLHFVKELFLFERKKVLLIFICCILTIISLIFFIRFLFLPYTGLIVDKPEIISKNSSLIFSPRFLHSPAIAAGLKTGDIILKINNKPISGMKMFIDTIYKIKTFSLIRIDFQRDNKIEEVFIQPELMLLKIDWIFTFILASVLVVVGFIILIYVNNKEYYPFILSLFLYMLFICVKAFYYESFFVFLLFQIGTISVFLLPVFSIYYPSPWFSGKIRICMFILFILLYGFYIGFVSVSYIKGISTNSNNWIITIELLEKIRHFAEVIAILSFFIILLRSYFKNISKKIRNQIEWILTGFILAFSPYFFFEQLPLILGNFIHEKVSLGNFAHIFICIFPVFFLIGLYEHNRKKFKYIIPVYVYHLCVIPLFLFFFLIISDPLHSYLIQHYGFSINSAYLFIAFFYLLSMQPVLIIGMRILNKIINTRTYKNSLQYISALESENALFKEKYISLLHHTNSDIQTDKLKDLVKIFQGIYSYVYKGSSHISKSLLKIQKQLKSVMLVLKNSSLLDEIEIEEKKTDINKPIHDITLENLKIQELIVGIHKNFHITPSLPSWIGSDYIIHKIITEIKKLYPYVMFNTKQVTDHYFYCSPSNIVQAFINLISYVLDYILPHDTNFIIKTFKKASLLIIELEYWSPDLNNEYLKNIFEPFIKKQEHKGYNELSLYITKTLIEKNNGSISTHYSENKTRFITQFSLEKKI